MPAPDYTVEIDKLTAALAVGHDEITIDGQTIRYRSIDEILKAINHFQGLAKAFLAGTQSPQFGASFAAFNRD